MTKFNPHQKWRKKKPKTQPTDDEIPEYQIYTDGSFRRPSYGAYGALTIDLRGKTPIESIEVFPVWETTSNRMELMGIIHGLESINDPSTIHIYSDSQYAVYCGSSWIHGWHKNGYILQSGMEVKNRDLIERLRQQMLKHKISFFWVRSHQNTNSPNDRIDAAVQTVTNDMFSGKLQQK